LTSQSSTSTIQHPKFSDVENSKNILIKSAKLISINQIKKLPELIQFNKNNEKVAKIFAMVVNSFREQNNKQKFEFLDLTYNLIDFFAKNASSILMEIFTIINKIDRQKYNYDEICSIYKLYKLSEGNKLVSLDMKSILCYISRLKEYIDGEEKLKLSSIRRKSRAKRGSISKDQSINISTIKKNNSKAFPNKNFKAIIFPKPEDEQ